MRLIFYIFYYLVVKIARHETLGMYIKNICEKMGIVYIKLAQILSTRSDIIKDEQSRKDLSLINDSCNLISFKQIEEILMEEYGKELYTKFNYIDSNPIGSASISQVHKAILDTGEEVALKIKRKDILKNVRKDSRNIKIAIGILAIFSKSIRFLYKSRALDLYIKWIYEETDFNKEKENIKEMYDYHIKLNSISSIENSKKFLLVKLYEDYCTDNVIVMQYIPYDTINKLEINDENSKLMKESVNSYLRHYFHALFNFDEAIFHGDPHSGNIFIDEHGNIGFLDFGLVFKFNKNQMEMIKKLASAMYRKDFDTLYELILRISGKYGFLYNERKKEEKLKSDLRRFLIKIDDINVTNWFMEMAFLFLRNNLFPPDYYYEFGKAFLALDGIILFSLNEVTGYELLYKQFSKYYIKEMLENVTKNICNDVENFYEVFMQYVKDLSI